MWIIIMALYVILLKVFSWNFDPGAMLKHGIVSKLGSKLKFECKIINIVKINLL